MSPSGAVVAASSVDLETRIDAREYAEGLGYEAFRTKAPMPAEFAGAPVLSEGFEEGLANARCEHEQVRAGLL